MCATVSTDTAQATDVAQAFQADVRAARDGDADAFGRLYQQIYRNLYHIARFSLRSTEDAADVVSDTVLDAFASIGKLRDESAFRAWMFRILSAKIKRKQRDYHAEVVELDESNSPAVAFPFAAPELAEALATLQPEERLLLSLQVQSGYSSKELAKVFGGTASGIRTRLLRIRMQLRVRLTQETERERSVSHDDAKYGTR